MQRGLAHQRTTRKLVPPTRIAFRTLRGAVRPGAPTGGHVDARPPAANARRVARVIDVDRGCLPLRADGRGRAAADTSGIAHVCLRVPLYRGRRWHADAARGFDVRAARACRARAIGAHAGASPQVDAPRAIPSPPDEGTAGAISTCDHGRAPGRWRGAGDYLTATGSILR